MVFAMAHTNHHGSPEALSPASTATALGLSTTTVHRRIKDGTIQAVRIGRRVCVPVTELERILKTAA